MVKLCKRCDTKKPLYNFSRNRVRPDGFNDWCKQCVREYKVELRKTDPNFERRTKVKQLYGITWQEYQTLMDAPCAICGGVSEHLDHDHVSGKPRSALCQNCNLMLGQAREIPTVLRAAADYLEEHSATNS